MSDYPRLFDIIHQKAAKDPDKIAYADKHEREDGRPWRTNDFEGTVHQINGVSLGLLNLGIEKDDKIGRAHV